MTKDPLLEPLRGLVAFNPDLFNKEELIASFIARQDLLDRLLDDLRREPADSAPQHHLILGQRGMGKTTLLHRLRYAIEDDPVLAAVWLPLTFPEEQYNVAGLVNFWRNCLDSLCGIYEERNQQQALVVLEKRIDALPPGDEQAALHLLLSETERLQRRLVLLVDNVDMVLSRIAEEQEWAFRRLLSAESRLLLISASSRMLESFYDYGKPFYDFFKTHDLGPLKDQDMFNVLETLAQRLNKLQVANLVKKEPGRLRALRELTGGNPRTVLLLFHLLSQGPDGDVRSDLERLLDLNTPLYKARLEELPPQAQRVISAVALRWAPATAAMLAQDLNLEVKIVSAQLSRLEEMGLVEKTRYPGKKAAFQIAERFFNIWYLMRSSRRPRRSLIWLARFLQTFFTEVELCLRAERLLQQGCLPGDLNHAQEAFALAQVIDSPSHRRALEHSALHALVDHDRWREQLSKLVDLSDLPPELHEKKARMEKLRELKEKVLQSNVDFSPLTTQEFWRLLGGSPDLSLAEKVRTVEGLADMDADQLKQLLKLLRNTEKGLLNLAWKDKDLVDALYDAVARGDIENTEDWEGAEAVVRSYPKFYRLPFLLVGYCTLLSLNKGVDKTQLVLAEQFYRERLAQPQADGYAWNGFGNLLEHGLKRHAEAEAAYRRSIEIDSQNAVPWNNLGSLLAHNLQRPEEAEAAYRLAIEIDRQYSQAWNNLGSLLENHFHLHAEAETAYRRAIEYDPQFAIPWNNLGNLLLIHLKRYDEAEAAYRRAIEIDPQLAVAWNGLGHLFQYFLRRYAEAESAYRRAAAIDPKFAFSWKGLGDLFRLYYRQPEEAVRNYCKAISLYEEGNRNYVWWWLIDTLWQLESSSLELPNLQTQWEQQLGPEDRIKLFARIDHEITSRQPKEIKSFAECVAALLPQEHWPKAIETWALLRQDAWSEALETVRTTFSEDAIQGVDFLWIKALAEAVRQNHGAEICQIMEETKAHERMRPLYAALQAATLHDSAHLLRQPAEVRRVAELLLAHLIPELSVTSK
jgi:tetratricopeptide (TPR) repeat protein